MNVSLEKIRRLPFIENLYYFETVDSTNNFAKRLSLLPASGFTVICADVQSSGRGRGDNTFFSEVKGGLFVSIVCTIPDITAHFTYNRAISLAIFDAINFLFPNAPLFIKWPNDIYWQDKKLCGILLEPVPSNPHHLVIGFGINVNLHSSRFPRDIRDSATSILDKTGTTPDIHDLLYDIVKRFRGYQSIDSAGSHLLYVRRLYKPGKFIEIGGRRGIFDGVAEDGRLVLKTKSETEYITSGTVRFLTQET
jgi:BirA family transcriptional regulator, biotin operon repressor / biotin---[acetyl-CoA-carboxylase] ligase